MKPKLRSAAAASFFFALMSLASLVSAQTKVHKDARLGFSIKPPTGWTEVPVPSREHWIVAQYQAPKEDQVYDKESAASWRHRPRMYAIAFLDAVMSRPDVEEDEETGKTRVHSVTPFESYEQYVEAYLKNTYGLGYFKEDEGDGELKGVPYRWMEIKAQSVGGPDVRLLTWIYQLELGEVAIQLECFESEYTKRKKRREFKKVMTSFRSIPRTEPLDLGRDEFISVSTLGSLSPEKRGLARREQERQDWSRMSENLPKGWTAKEIDGINVVYHVDDRYAREVVAHVKATRRWLEETFAAIGPSEYARYPVVRICEDRQERDLFFSGTGTSALSALTTYEGAGMGYVSQRTLDLWFFDRDQDTYFNMPAWLKEGLIEIVGTASVKGKSLEFWDGADDGLHTPPRSLMTMIRGDFADAGWRVRIDAERLVRFLMTTRSKKYRRVIPDYLANLKAVLEEVRLEERKGGTELEKPTNEEEEDAYLEALRVQALERESRILNETLSRTFAEWSNKDWETFQAKFGR